MLLTISKQLGRKASYATIRDNSGKKMSMYQAINDAITLILSENRNSAVIGEDIEFGGVFRCTIGLKEQFGLK